MDVFSFSPQMLADVALQGEHIGKGIADFGKALTFGVAIGLGGLGAAVGIAVIFSTMISSVARQPEAKGELTGIMWLGFALVEAIVFYALVAAMLAHALV